MKISVLIIASLIFFSFAQGIPGGISQADLNSVTNQLTFQQCDRAVREEFQRKYGGTLGEVVSVQSQIVAGVRYYITYNYNGKSVYADVVFYAGEKRIEVIEMKINSSKPQTTKTPNTASKVTQKPTQTINSYFMQLRNSIKENKLIPLKAPISISNQAPDPKLFFSSQISQISNQLPANLQRNKFSELLKKPSKQIQGKNQELQKFKPFQLQQRNYFGMN